MKITIIGFRAGDSTSQEQVTHWPDELNEKIAIARAAREGSIALIDKILVEEKEENET